MKVVFRNPVVKISWLAHAYTSLSSRPHLTNKENVYLCTCKIKYEGLKVIFTIWITGLPASGKTTLGEILSKRFEAVLLDGDMFRKTISEGLGYSKEDRMDNIRRAANVAEFLNDSGFDVVACFITPYEKIRNEVRQIIEKNGHRFVLVFAKCPLQECIRRDVKGLYAKAMKGEIDNLTGYSAPYEEPKNPDIVLKTDRETVQESVNKILKFLDKENIWKIKATLFIGRFSPPHKGHKYIFDSVLDNGGKIVIAVRDTPLSKENPYTASQRKKMLEKLYEKNEDVEVIVIPDIDSVCVGRRVGYRIMKVPESIEGISATKIRKENKYGDVPKEIIDLVKEFDKENSGLAE